MGNLSALCRGSGKPIKLYLDAEEVVQVVSMDRFECNQTDTLDTSIIQIDRVASKMAAKAKLKE